MRPDTETLDRLYLEWSQFTGARTRREVALADALRRIIEPAPGVSKAPAWIRSIASVALADAEDA